jgi:hypothetical protein
MFSGEDEMKKRGRECEVRGGRRREQEAIQGGEQKEKSRQ